MTSAELAGMALRMKNMTLAEEDAWTTFEVIENGELGTGSVLRCTAVQYLELASFLFSEDDSDLQLNILSLYFMLNAQS